MTPTRHNPYVLQHFQQRFGAMTPEIGVPLPISSTLPAMAGKVPPTKLPVSLGERALNGVSAFMQWVRSSTVNELVVIDELSMGLPRALIELFLRPFNRLVLARETFFRENAGLITMGPMSGWLTGAGSLGLNRPSILNPKGLNLKAHINLEVAHHFLTQAHHDIHHAQPHQTLEQFREHHIKTLLGQMQPTDLPHWQAYAKTQRLSHQTSIPEVPEALQRAFALPDRDALAHIPITPEGHHATSVARMQQAKTWLKDTLAHTASWGMTEKITLQDAQTGKTLIPRRPLSSTLTDLKHYTHEVFDYALAQVKQAGHNTMTPEAKQALQYLLFEHKAGGVLPHANDAFLHYLNKQKRLTATVPIGLAVVLAIIPNYVNIWLTKRQTGSTLFPAEAPTMNASTHAEAKTEDDAKVTALSSSVSSATADNQLVTVGELKKQLSQTQKQAAVTSMEVSTPPLPLPTKRLSSVLSTTMTTMPVSASAVGGQA
jgi:hypothetical protein